MSPWRPGALFRRRSRRPGVDSRTPNRFATRRRTPPLQVVVIGAGIGGLTSALLLGRRGHRVLVIEQEPVAAPGSLTDAGWWWRSTAPQTAHSHIFAARTRELLAAEAPDVLVALRESGIGELNLAQQAPTTLTGPVAHDPRLIALTGRRSVFEWVLRRAVLAEPTVTMLAGLRAGGLVTRAAFGSVPRVAGVRLSNGHQIEADLVVDAAGRRSPVGGWVADAGGPDFPEQLAPGGFTSFTRFYELATDRDSPAKVLGGSYAGYACKLFPAGGNTFSVTFEIPHDDDALTGLVDARSFDHAAGTVPELAGWLDDEGARPLTRVAVMTGQRGRLRRLVEDGRPVVTGMLPVGDAVCSTNPGHARGVGLTMLSAVRVVQAVDAYPGARASDVEARTLAMDAAVGAELAPWFHDSAQRDGARLHRWRTGERPIGASSDGRLTHAEVTLAAQRDPSVWAAAERMQNLLSLPSAVLGDPDTIRRARAVIDGDWRPTGRGAPSRDELVETVTAGAARATP